MVYDTTISDQDQELEDFWNFEKIIRIVIPIVFAVIALLGFIGNGLVIWTILTNQKMRSPTNLLILNLAVADFLFIVICVPFTGAGYVLSKYVFGTVWCKISQYFIYVCACVSIYSLVLMSVVRCIVVVRPLRTKSFVTRQRVYIAIAVVWIVILGGFSPLLVQYEVYSYSYYGEERAACTNLAASKSEHLRKTFYAMFFTFGYALPLYIMVILYGIALKTLKCGTRKSTKQARSTSGNQKKGRATKIVIIVIFCFLLCWLPIQVIFMLQIFGDYPDTIAGIIAQMLANCLAYFNSCMNPILYAFLSSRFRQSFKQALCCGRHHVTGQNSRSLACLQGEQPATTCIDTV